jgi:hypothetical protein
MRAGARHRPLRQWRPLARRAAIPAALWLALLGGAPATAETITAAEYASPTARYPHGALGDRIEYAALMVRLAEGHTIGLRLANDRVFEDTAPRLADLDGDGAPEVITVESQADTGARLVVWTVRDGVLVERAATAPIGRRFRWLAPVGAADLDGDGGMEIAYVETPHLGKVLKIVRLEGDRLRPVAEAAGLTNHRIGDPYMQGGIFRCGKRLAIVTADADWSRLVATVVEEGGLRHWDMGAYEGPESFDRVKGCRPLTGG